MFEDTRNTVQEEIKSLSLPAKPRTNQDESPKKELTFNLENAAKSLEAAANEKFGRQQHYMAISLRTVKDSLLKSSELNDDAKNLLSSTFSIIDKYNISIGEVTEISKSISSAYKNGITEKEYKELLGKVLELRAPETAIEPLKKAKNHADAIKIISDIVSSEQKEMKAYEEKANNSTDHVEILDSKAIKESLDKAKNKEIINLIKSVEDAGCELKISSDGGFISVVGKGGYPIYLSSMDGFSFKDDSVNVLEDNLKSANSYLETLDVEKLNSVITRARILTVHESVQYESGNSSCFSISLKNPEYTIKIPFPDIQELSRDGNLKNEFNKYLKNLESVVKKLE
jgi:hypothetical protein